MPITQAINSKANVKKFTNSDLPFSTRQPVINSHYETSTASQSVINLPFSVDQANTDAFFLYVDGKLLRLGASNDYIFTAIDSNDTSSQVTLNTTMVVDLNIQAFKLGSKTESEFLIDNRFQQVYEAQSVGFQAFVNTASFISVATQTAGTPAAGFFYSSINNRASMPDLSQDLKVRMGPERAMVQSIFALQNETGPANEIVWGAVNDLFGQMRFVGSWSNINSTSGPLIRSGANITDFVEFTFYGTGVNLITTFDDANRNAVYSIDGGAESADFFPASLSSLLVGRNTAANQIVTLTNGLTLGVHTVKIRNNTASNDLNIYGFEVLNESSSVKTNPGIAYNQGKKSTLAAQSSVAYNSGVTGTRGGRMLIYQNSDGTIGRAFQATDASTLTLASANHANEEIARVYHWREFGANRADDFSTLTTGVSLDRAFTLDDGTTSLLGRNVTSNTNLSVDGSDYLSISGVGNFIILTFVGTGLDVHLPGFTGGGTGDTCSVSIDGGATIGNIQCTTGKDTIVKIASGLPYGTHTVNINRTQSIVFWAIEKFIVYQPKKPALPSGAIELADYNVVADYSASTVAGTTLNDNADMYQGVIAKAVTREVSLVGSFSSPTIPSNFAIPGGFHYFTTTNTNYVEYSFFGTGAALHFTDSASGTYTHTVTVDGANFATAVDLLSMTNNGSGSYTVNTAVGGQPSRLVITGLSLGLHKIRVTRTGGGAAGTALVGIYIITPIHAHKSNVPYDIQNTLPVGSLGISDNRKFSPVKSESPSKNIAQAFGVASAPSTNSTVIVPCPDMSVAHTNRSGKIRVSYSINTTHNSTASLARYYIFVDGVQMSQRDFNPPANSAMLVNDLRDIDVSPGTHKIDVYWSVTGNTSTLVTTQRTLTVEEI